MSTNKQAHETKICCQCNKECTKDQFAVKQWKKPENPSCRLCGQYSNVSQEKDRVCHRCHERKPRIEFDIHQWSRGDQAVCGPCREATGNEILSSIGNPSHTSKQYPDGTLACRQHSLECCDICMMDFSLPNQFARKRNSLGRETLTKQEEAEISDEWKKSNGIRISRKMCIMDGQAVCPRTSRKMRCPCEEVTYCSKACQLHHWTIHKITCKFHAEKAKKKAEKKAEADRKARAGDLTEDQKNVARKEAFLAEQSGRKGAIEDCAWQLCEHPLVIGGGSIRIGRDGIEFIKGDVAEIYREHADAEWDGSSRFGLRPYVPPSNPEDWISVAREANLRVCRASKNIF